MQQTWDMHKQLIIRCAAEVHHHTIDAVHDVKKARNHKFKGLTKLCTGMRGLTAIINACRSNEKP